MDEDHPGTGLIRETIPRCGLKHPFQEWIKISESHPNCNNLGRVGNPLQPNLHGAAWNLQKDSSVHPGPDHQTYMRVNTHRSGPENPMVDDEEMQQTFDNLCQQN
ncbi:hypothetical protein BLOT_014822 [Blomia tropicalis]|nr:hypothetical protein BLOT_014822 [Blomia tropicalis]